MALDRHRHRRPLRSGLLALIAPLVATLPAHGVDNAMIQLSNADNGSRVEVGIGTQITVTLQTIGSGHYGPPSVSSTAVRFIDVSDGPPNPGGPVQVMRFRAHAAGGARISIPFTGGTGPSASTPPFTLRVQVSAPPGP